MRALVFYAAGVASGAVIAICAPAIAQIQTGRPIAMGDIQTIVEIWNRIKSEYVDPLDDKRMMEGCISGMAALDPQSGYLREREFKDVAMPSPDIAGIGIELASRNGQIVVIAPLDSGPASRVGIQPDDILLTVDGLPLAGLTLPDVVDKLRGEANTEVVVTLWRSGAPQPLEKRLIRELTASSSVRALMLADEVVYLRVSRFTAQTSKAVKNAITGVVGAGTPKGFVVDLRNNPGGLLNGAIDVADIFIRSGVIMTITGRNPESIRTFSASGTGPYDGAPTVVLVNRGTAAASEIVAESLRINGHAKIFGTKTFGRGTIQTVLPLVNNTAIKITTGRWQTARGETLEGRGLTPDIELPVNAASFYPDPIVDPWVARALREIAVQQGPPGDHAVTASLRLQGE